MSLSVYELCKALYRRGKLTQEKLDIYYAADRLDAEQYKELTELIK